MAAKPPELFAHYLDNLKREGWLKSYVWSDAASFTQLKTKMGALNRSSFTRSHKKDLSGHCWNLDVEFPGGFVLGVDLELSRNRPVLNNPHWLLSRFGLDDFKTHSKERALEEWVKREAMFKACYPFNNGLVLSVFKPIDHFKDVYAAHVKDNVYIELEAKVISASDWIMGLARRKA